MADDLSLLFRLKAQNQASPVIRTVQADASRLAQTVGADFNRMSQVSTVALGRISSALSDLSANAPIAGRGLSSISNVLGSVSDTLNKTTPRSKEFSASVDAIAKSSGKTRGEITQFLSTFSKIEGAAAKNDAAFKLFGGSVDLIGNKTAKFLPELEAASTKLADMTAPAASAGAAVEALVGPIGLAIAALGAAAIGAVAFTKALVDVAVQAADTQGKLFDLSQQTGVTVETLSALDLLAKQTGGNIESLSQSLVVFQGNMDAAQDPTSKQAKLFEDLNVTITDTEDTLRQTLAALAKMPEGFEQTNRAAEVFGRRGGKQFLAILKESHGDIDQTIRELQGLGLANSENARRADEFNDQLVKLQTQILGLQVTIGNQAIPAILEAMKELERFLKDNKEAIDALGFAARFAATSLTNNLKTALIIAKPYLETGKAVVDLLADAYERLAAAAQLASGKLPTVNPNAIPAQPLSTPESGQKLLDFLDKLRVQQEQASQFGLKPFNLEEIFGLKKAKGSIDPAIQLLKQLQGEIRSLENATKAETVAAELLDGKYKNINPTIRERILVTARLIDQLRLNIDTEKKLAEEEEKRQREIEQAGRDITQFLQQQIEDLARLRGETVSAADEAERFIRQIKEIPGALRDSDASWIRFNATLIDSERHLKIIRDLLEDIANQPPPPGGDKPVPVNPNPVPDFGPPPEAEKRWKGLEDAIRRAGDAIARLLGLSGDFGQQFGDLVLGVIDDMAFGVGDLVHQWVLLGETGPAAMRKLTASVLAGLSAQAATKAIFQLAEGFAALFFNPAEAAAHFKSAALFGAVAGVAAAAGRGVAGDLFKNPSGGGSGAGAGSNNGQLNPLTLNRNQPQTQRIIVEVRTNDSLFGKAISAHVVKDIQEAGPIRETIANDGRFS